MGAEEKLTQHVPPPGARRFTYADYVDFPDDGQRYEILDGEVLVTASPAPDHQRVTTSLLLVLRAWTQVHPPAEVFPAPIDLILADDTVLVPDLLVSLDRATVTSRGVEAAPALVVEILSPSTRHRDRSLKRQRCARSGVREFWVVDPGERFLEQYVLADSGELEIAATRRAGEVLLSRSLAGLEFPVEVAFADLDPPAATG